ncbi:MAG: hypothetical protein JWN66_3856 [Sphingomonas bacterium]|uniref:hypothetical protein n=1 Tax=Sphingomonas bacterium TaxID=1895847 RepID=UPI002614A2E0|nr:hypothetical protein [Sphingomonas bacterium]MDB5706740.1 hypothetical protein [Sphingomonas bacterium]
MRISRTSVALGAIAALLIGAGLPALGQDKPESILPPGFGDPVAAPAPTPAPTSTTAATPRPASTDAAAVPEGGVPTPIASATPGASPAQLDPAALARYDMPDYARRSLAIVGPVGADNGGLGPKAFGTADGRYLESLMRHLDVPIASRWLSIALRRALVSRVDTPHGVNGADFAAERAWLLLRMGESVAARGVVQSVDSGDYTPKLYEIAMQAALATGDPGALCPVAEGGAALRRERAWILARAMCAGLAGQPGKAQPMIASARNSGLASGIDLLLAQKVAGTGARGQQAVTIEWDNVDRLTAWRYGLATASGVEIPEALFATVLPNVQAFRAQSPMLTARVRAGPAEQAAVRGVFSSAALVDLYGAVDAEDDQSLAESGIARDLRTAYAAADLQIRLDTLKQLWDEPKTPDARFARLILTARAAARIPVDTEGADVDRLVASMLTAGIDRGAMRWEAKARAGGDAWAMLALANPVPASFGYSDVNRYQGSGGNSALKKQMFFAGLAGLGRMPASEIERGARSLDVAIGDRNPWTRAIARAAEARQPGTVLVLAGIGMQTRLWRGVPPETLFHIVTALRAVGLEGEARMIAAEALARL